MRAPTNPDHPNTDPIRESTISTSSLAGLLLAGAALFLTVMVAIAEPAPANRPASPLDSHLVKPSQMQSGGLLLQSNRPGHFVIAPRLATDVQIRVNGPLARAIVTQRFENPSDQWVEGIYVFPLPHDAAVDTLKLRIGDRFIEGQIKPRKAAKKIYDKAKREGRKASLVEQQRPNVFTNAIANIGPHETIVVQLEYQHAVAASDETYTLRFPLTVAPRFNSQPAARNVVSSNPPAIVATYDPAPDRGMINAPVLDPKHTPKVNPVALRIELKTGFPIARVKSHHHDIATKPLGEDHVVLTLDQGVLPADRDFELSWKASGNEQPRAALFRQRIGEADYLMATIVPPADGQEPEAGGPPRDLIFVVDTSGSMAGRSIDQARASLNLALDRLRPEDRFNILRYADDFSVFSSEAMAASKENLGKARKFVDGLNAEGGTRLLPALRAALADKYPADRDRLRQIVFMTDGAIGNEREFFKILAAQLGRSRLFTVGIGSAPNSHFMARAAQIGRGSFVHIGNHEQIGERMANLLTRLERPAATHLEAVWSQTGITDTAPDPLPDLYHGQPIILTARAATLEGTLTLKGQRAGRPWQVEMPLAQAIEAVGLDKLWARRKIADLEVERLTGKDKKAIDGRIEKLALAHHLVSRTTSLVAVDVTPTRPAGAGLASAILPVNLPDGWDFGSVFGQQKSELPQREAFLKSNPELRRIQYAAMKGLSGPLKMASPGTSSFGTSNVILPATATDAGLSLALGAVLIFFAMILAMVSLLWNNLTRQVRISHRPSWENWK